MVAALAVPAGLIFGSFATVVAHRVPRRESFVAGRSRCPHCGSTIAAYDNIPVVSWLLLRGRCRNCREAIPARYPLTELTMAALFVATVLILGTDDATELALGLTFCALLVVVTLTDLERRVIPNGVLVAGAVAAVAIAAIGDPSSLPDRAIAAAAAGGFLLLVALVYPRGMGMGDVKLAAVMGLYLGRVGGARPPDRVCGRCPFRDRHDGSARCFSTQAGRSLRALPGAGRIGRAVVGKRACRLVSDDFHQRLMANRPGT